MWIPRQVTVVKHKTKRLHFNMTYDVLKSHWQIQSYAYWPIHRHTIRKTYNSHYKHTDKHACAHAHTHSRVHTPPDARAYPDTHTHARTHARARAHASTNVLHIHSRDQICSNTNLKSTSNVLQLAPLTQIIVRGYFELPYYTNNELLLLIIVTTVNC